MAKKNLYLTFIFSHKKIHGPVRDTLFITPPSIDGGSEGARGETLKMVGEREGERRSVCATMAHSWSVTGGVKRNDGHSSDENFRPNANYTDDNRSGDYWHAATFPYSDTCIPQTISSRIHTRPRIDIIPMRARVQVHIATVKTRIEWDWIRGRARSGNCTCVYAAIDRVDRPNRIARIRFERPLEKVEYETWNGNVEVQKTRS